MEIALREDSAPDIDFYYTHQFEIYREPYLIWDRDTWGTVLATCRVYRLEVNGGYAGDIILEGRRKGLHYIVDFSLLPEYQGKGIGKRALEEVEKMGGKFTAITRRETLPFFLKAGFRLRRTVKGYYYPGVDGYFISYMKAKNA